MPGAVGDEEFAEFTRARWGPLGRFAYGLTLDVGRAEDLVQEALVRFWRVRGRVAVDRPEAYVRRTLVNLAVTAGRRRWWSERVLGRIAETSSHPESDPGYGSAQRDELRRALARLPARRRVVVVLRYVEDRSERQVAELLGCSVGSVKSQASRGLTALRGTPAFRAVPEAVSGVRLTREEAVG
ncbi:SigE family RNA polymerase sigma factor [Streptomyces sp. NBC_01351]|uniref:SigE family RNA polymerase sigma factor n=1 Tax=Streptomyces sp. NBC_01351 TaxID=2903833 RepID=UPI002E2EBD48|nr:SigE family RNA polymerase sigma factor [Streptomyces sp. NBC_01351]